MLSVDERRGRFAEIYRECFRDVLSYALRRCRDQAVASEVAAETFAVVWRRLEDVPHGDDARPWVFGVARRVLANERRSTSRRDRLAARVAAVSVEAPVVDTDVDERVEATLARLSPADAELLRLSYWEGFKPAELAVVFGVGASTIRSQLTRARQRFSDEFQTVVRSEQLSGGHDTDDEHTLVPECEEHEA